MNDVFIIGLLDNGTVVVGKLIIREKEQRMESPIRLFPMGQSVAYMDLLYGMNESPYSIPFTQFVFEPVLACERAIKGWNQIHNPSKIKPAKPGEILDISGGKKH